MANNKSRLSAKGLDKIFGEGITDVINEIENNEELKSSATEIILAQVLPNPHQPRKVFNDEELKELSKSIIEHGLIQPIIVKKTTNGYYLVAGERRVRAARLANLTKLPAIIVDFNDQQMKEVALIENIQRVDLNAIEEAIAFKELLDLLKLTQDALSERIGKSRSHIANTIRLLSLPKEVQDYVLNGKLTMGQVKPLISLKLSDNELKSLVEKIVSDNLSARQVEDLVKEQQGGGETSTAKKVQKRSINEFLENKIMRKLGTKVTVEEKKIIINYVGVKDLNRILEILGLTDD
ncbi:ParB/RepB/Spo0J family partition protein [Spiroplasma chrysopicola]|uniref:Site-specific DNA-binding protein n=1 Tax=Spiroplasma chrysopicola DF-1 TaxID=1276227 RepID=R4U2P7_9MOLU|nr:ParB/RepB/Spo0J family partition protein [Spiroplasma chrysopicola]AGM24743.1 site-specific DNA-binding protein [Spiroplasma chrysopicola DF-1]